MNFKSIFAGAAAVAGALALFTGCGESADNNTLVLATEATFPPYEFRSAGQIVGVDIDICQAVADKLGKKLDIQDTAFDSVITHVVTGKADIAASGITITEDRKKNVLFSGTIKDNLRWGNETATDDEMVEACRLAQADDFIRSFPDGYDTYIEQGGTNISGGQKQRLCIARALLKKPNILILDDSTSAVDTRTDALIREGFRTYIPETTKIIIAQRVASVQDADLILVMNNGRIADMGTHEQLLTSSAIYREVYESQTNGGDGHEA